jgi:hypothetical protein
MEVSVGSMMIFGVRMFWVMVTASIEFTVGRGVVFAIITMAVSMALSITISRVLPMIVIIMV